MNICIIITATKEQLQIELMKWEVSKPGIKIIKTIEVEKPDCFELHVQYSEWVCPIPL